MYQSARRIIVIGLLAAPVASAQEPALKSILVQPAKPPARQAKPVLEAAEKPAAAVDLRSLVRPKSDNPPVTVVTPALPVPRAADVQPLRNAPGADAAHQVLPPPVPQPPQNAVVRPAVPVPGSPMPSPSLNGGRQYVPGTTPTPAAQAAQRPIRLGASVKQSSRGLIVHQVYAGSIAEQVGVRPGDRLVSLHRRPLSTADQLRTELARGASNSVLAIQRQGHMLHVPLRLGPGTTPSAARVPAMAASMQQPYRLQAPGGQSPHAPGQSQVSRPASPGAEAVAATGRPPSQPPRPSAGADRPPAQADPNRPLIGDGGRLIGGGRVWNSTVGALLGW